MTLRFLCKPRELLVPREFLVPLCALLLSFGIVSVRRISADEVTSNTDAP